MVPAFGMVILPQNLSTGNGHVPGWSCILSVAIVVPVHVIVTTLRPSNVQCCQYWTVPAQGAAGTADKAMRTIRNGGVFIFLPGKDGGGVSKHPKAGVKQINYGAPHEPSRATLIAKPRRDLKS